MKNKIIFVILILMMFSGSVFALTDYDKETILGYIATRQNSITYNYGDELFENIENFNYVLFGTGYHNNQTNIVLTNVIPNTNSTTFSSIENLKTLQYGTTVDYASIYNITSTPTVKLSSSTSRGYGVEASTTFSLKPTNGYYGILNSPLLNDDASNREVILEGGQPYFNFMSTYWDYEENTLRVYLGRQYNSDFSFENNKPTSITISLYDVRGVLSSQRIYNCDYTSSDYHENTNSFHIKLDKNDFYSSNTDVYLKIIVGVSSGTNWYERWYTPPIDWNQEAGTGGETPPIGGSSNITGTITGSGTVDENGNIIIDNSVNIDTTPITDAIQQGNDYIMQEPIYNEDGTVSEESGGLVASIINGIWNILRAFLNFLFQPNEEQIQDLVDDVTGSDIISDSILGLPLNLISRFLNVFNNVRYTDWVLEWDNINLDLKNTDGNEFSEQIIAENSFNITEFVNSDETLSEIYGYYLILVNFGAVCGLIYWCSGFFKDLLGLSQDIPGANDETESPDVTSTPETSGANDAEALQRWLQNQNRYQDYTHSPKSSRTYYKSIGKYKSIVNDMKAGRYKK